MPNARRQSFEEPDMRTGRCQLNVTEALTADFGKCDFHAALVADHAAMLHSLVFTAQALPVRDRPENSGTEQAVTLRLEGAVVDGLGFCYLAMRPAPDFLRGCQADADGIEIGNRCAQIKWT